MGSVSRADHACATYINENGQNVLLVTGGIGSNNRQLDSTEVMVDFTSWRGAAQLPSHRYGLRAATVDNKVFIFGGGKGGTGGNSILQYDSNTWQPAGTMITSRRDHA